MAKIETLSQTAFDAKKKEVLSKKTNLGFDLIIKRK